MDKPISNAEQFLRNLEEFARELETRDNYEDQEADQEDDCIINDSRVKARQIARAAALTLREMNDLSIRLSRSQG